MLSINGSYLEGGGQIVRTALALSALTGREFEIKDIRKGRKKSGLKPQHLYAIKALKEFCNAEVEGDALGSSYLKFVPKKFAPKNMVIDIKTAGSVTLLMQSLLPALALSQKKIKLNLLGGTDTQWAMPVDYFKNVFMYFLRPYADIEVSIFKRGYYPKGSGRVDIAIKPKFGMHNRELAPRLSLIERGKLLHIKGISHASKFLEKSEVAMRQKKSAELALKHKSDIAVEYCDTLSTGSGVVLWAVYEKTIIGADCLGKRGRPSEEIGFESAKNLLAEMNMKGAVDSHLTDNLIPFLGLFGGVISANKLSKHTLTNIYTTELFLDVKFQVDKEKNIIKSGK